MKTGQFINTKGYRASGSFKVNKKKAEKKKTIESSQRLGEEKQTHQSSLQKQTKIIEVRCKRKDRARKTVEKTKKSQSKEISSVKKKTPVVPKKDSYREAFA